jgi:adenine-specific DNA-methyltransferase
MAMSEHQIALLRDRSALEASLAAAADEVVNADQYGAVFTRRWVVDLILDLVGYTSDRDLASMLALEPACGTGAFLGPMVERLAESCERRGQPITDARDAIYAGDLQPGNVAASRTLVESVLVGLGHSPDVCLELAEAWVHHDDFLLSEHRHAVADFAVGNPPYIRLEDVSPARSAAYRSACPTMGGRADVFVGFFEVALKSLKPDGVLGFICADRWMRNNYGQKLRQLVTEEFAVDATIEMHQVDAFDAEVDAYPSVTIIRNGEQREALVANARPSFGAASAKRIRPWAKAEQAAEDEDFDAARLPGWFSGQTSWPTGSPERLSLLADLEHRLPTLEAEDPTTKVGIGVATGADRVFVVKDTGLVEEDRMLPMAMARDTMTGHLNWSGSYLINPWSSEGKGLVELEEYPRLAAYYEQHAGSLLKRNVANRRPAQWYRTIDRVDHTLTPRPKLLFPDIKASIHPVLDEGGLYPHHNLYFVVSDAWDPRVLGGLLLSRVAQLFIEAYAVRMRGGFLRFQAQYLRRIRVPERSSVSKSVAGQLCAAFDARDVERATQIAMRLYGISNIPK